MLTQSVACCSLLASFPAAQLSHGSEVVIPGVRGWSSVAADFNGDGRTDVATVSLVNAQNSVRIHLADGVGGQRLVFEHTFVTGTVSHDVQLVVGDIDQDGDLDVVAAGTGLIARIMGDGAGRFQLQWPNRFLPGIATAAELADLTGDGAPDLVVHLLPDVVQVFENVGGAWATTPESLWPSYRAGCFTTVDVDGNGSLELALGTPDTGRVVLLSRTAPGTYAELAHLSFGQRVHRIVAADFDADQRIDFAVTVGEHGALRVVRQVAPLQFEATFADWVGVSPQRLIAPDLDGDGALDLVAAVREEGHAEILFGRGDGTFAAPTRAPAGRNPTTVTALDHDGDGDLDLLVGQMSGGSTQLVRNLGNRCFDATEAGRYPVASSPPLGFGSAIGDLDADGRPELVVCEGSAGTVRVFPNEGARAFGPSRSFAALPDTHRVWAMDIDGDGHLDLVVGGPETETLAVLYGRGDGSVEPPALVPTSVPGQLTSFADLDADGRLDIVVVAPNWAQSVTNTHVLLQLTPRNFVGRATLPDLAAVQALGAAELTGDNHLDLVVIEADFAHSARRLLLLIGQGDGSFVLAPPLSNPGYVLSSLVIDDFDDDGDADVIVPVGRSIQVLRNLGGALAWEVLHRSPFSESALALGDLDGDGRLDLVVTAVFGEDSAYTLRKLGGGAYAPASWVGFREQPLRVHLADLDGDGRGDFVAHAREALLVRYANP